MWELYMERPPLWLFLLPGFIIQPLLYIGAEFTESWANEMGGKIIPDEYAVITKTVEYQEDKTTGEEKEIRTEV